MDDVSLFCIFVVCCIIILVVPFMFHTIIANQELLFNPNTESVF